MMTSIIIGQSQRDKETREPDDAISITSGSKEGREKRPAMDLARGLSSAKWTDDGSLWQAFVASVRHLAVEKQLDISVLHGDGTLPRQSPWRSTPQGPCSLRPSY